MIGWSSGRGSPLMEARIQLPRPWPSPLIRARTSDTTTTAAVTTISVAAAANPYSQHDAHGAALERLQVAGQRVGAIVAALGPRIAGPFDRAREARAKVGTDASNRGVLAAPVRVADVPNRAAAHWIRAGGEVIQQDAKAVDVASYRRGVPCQYFRRGVQRRARQVGVRTGVKFAARAEVHEHDASVVSARDVLRLDVAMKQARGMNR